MLRSLPARIALGVVLFAVCFAAVATARGWSGLAEGPVVERAHLGVELVFFAWFASRALQLIIDRAEQRRREHWVVTAAGLWLVLALDVAVAVWAIAVGEYSVPAWPALTVAIILFGTGHTLGARAARRSSGAGGVVG